MKITYNQSDNSLLVRKPGTLLYQEIESTFKQIVASKNFITGRKLSLWKH